MSEKALASERCTIDTPRAGTAARRQSGAGSFAFGVWRRYCPRGGSAARLAAAILAGGLLAGCSQAWDAVTRPLDPLPPAEPQEIDSPQQGAGEYPNLSSVPDEPSRRPSRRDDREQIRESLASDRANAQYSGEAQTGEGIETRQSGDGRTGDGRNGGESAGASASSGSSDGSGASSPSAPATASNGDPSAAPDRPQVSERMPADDAGAANNGGGAAQSQAAAGSERDGAQQRSTGGSDRSDGSGADRRADREGSGDVPQLQQSQQGEPIEVPAAPDFGRAGTAGGSDAGRADAGGGDTARDGSGRDGSGRADSGRARNRSDAGQAPNDPGASGAQAGRSRTLSRGDAGGQVQAGGGRRIAVIYFRHGSGSLQARDRQVLRKVAELYQRQDRDLHVVGHASSRTASMDPIGHRMANFDTSLQRAQAVVEALVSMGVPRDAIQLEARGDNEPMYHEFMPTGEAGNRRAEVFLKG